jgi:hypothetical protein
MPSVSGVLAHPAAGAAEWALLGFVILAAIVFCVSWVRAWKPRRPRWARLRSETIPGVVLSVIGAWGTTQAPPWGPVLGIAIIALGVWAIAGAERSAAKRENAQLADVKRRGWILFRRMERNWEALYYRVFRFNTEVTTITVERDPAAKRKWIEDEFSAIATERIVVENRFHQELSDELYLFLEEVRDQYGFDISDLQNTLQAGWLKYERYSAFRDSLAVLLNRLQSL